MAKHPALRRRLLEDIAELQTLPYPNITLHVNDEDLTKPCLILTPEGWTPLHLTISIPSRYPVDPPYIKMDSNVEHPNVFGGYICASVLKHKGEYAYTPAYTLKGIAIQLLSFFSSDSVEQETGFAGTPGGGKINLEYYRECSNGKASYECTKCGFGLGASEEASTALPDEFPPTRVMTEAPLAQPATRVSAHAGSVRRTLRSSLALIRKPRPRTKAGVPARVLTISSLPNEVLLEILRHLDFEDLAVFAQSWSRISQLLASSDLIRIRELHCFVLKASYSEEKLGVGVNVNYEDGRRRQGKLESEFELLSHTAFHKYKVRKSIHGLVFDHWLPLPISEGHWRRVRDEAEDALSAIGRDANRGSSSSVLYAFMSDIITRLNTDLEFRKERKNMASKNSSLRHPSEKAIESYFHLFHILLCLATAGPAGDEIVQEANKMISVFMSGGTSKKSTPNLGYLLIALLISDVDPTEELLEAIVTEAITRNVVWMLDRRGAGMAELAYMESDEVSEYRIKKTFEGSLTSYRILMFSELFRRTARPSSRGLSSFSVSKGKAPESSGYDSNYQSCTTLAAESTTSSAPNLRSTGPAPSSPISKHEHLKTAVDFDRNTKETCLAPRPTTSESSSDSESTITLTNPSHPPPHSKPTKPTAHNSASPISTPSKPALQAPKIPLAHLRDELFTNHGSPPPGTTAHLASKVRRLHEIADFPSFFKEMGLRERTPAQMTAYLRDTVRASMDKGYSKIGIRTDMLMNMRLARDGSVDREAMTKEMERLGYQVLYPSSLEIMWRFEDQGFFLKQRG
ncbi:hypothetical protein B0T19DRAFT_398093 [Cercophora scortea]|uniref:UBC core domain-containing protein n=1 Tax=Cercophora scortea TaxID=314031 RepID=A0AAE0MH51_9PEZI|nr:hypothetical protein B0T19DRAFT_398093 [Cercophora scortea]